MSSTLAFDLSGLGVRLRGVPDDVAPLLRDEWRPFLAPVPPPFLELDVAESGSAMPGGEDMGLRLDPRFDATTARFDAEEGSVEVRANGHGEVRLSSGTTGRRFFGLSSLVAAATGWTLSLGRGLALHAAGAVLDGRAFLLVGPSGAGKTTWAEILRGAGATVLSDDVVLVETAGPVLALSVPFRVRPHRPAPPGRWPVAALLVARHGSQPALAPLPALRSTALLAANVLYVDASRRVTLPERLAEVPVHELTFRPDGSFLSLLRDLPR